MYVLTTIIYSATNIYMLDNEVVLKGKCMYI